MKCFIFMFFSLNSQEKFKKRELETIERTKQECERLAAEEAARVAQCHAEEIAKLEHRSGNSAKSLKFDLSCLQAFLNKFQACQNGSPRFLSIVMLCSI